MTATTAAIAALQFVLSLSPSLSVFLSNSPQPASKPAVATAKLLLLLRLHHSSAAESRKTGR